MLKYNNANRNNMDFYDTLTHEQATREYGAQVTDYQYNNMCFPSKLEMEVAQILDALDLDYKHEPKIMLGNEPKYPDFFIGLSIINFCFPTEVAGMLEKPDYVLKFDRDLSRYTGNGYLFDHDFILIGESRYHPFNDILIARTICNFINGKVEDALNSIGIDKLI